MNIIIMLLPLIMELIKWLISLNENGGKLSNLNKKRLEHFYSEVEESKTPARALGCKC